ncbi:MAG TPA: type II toxin-antitoxin system ParD family antitoxin [Thermomicrobiales bacterium]|nr:type II toxin-antitoxin system ParD family antitoxin [Thermomicrobiales bacterium]
MNVNLTPYWEKYIQEKIASGRYNNASEVIREALRNMEYVEEVKEFRAYAKDALAPEHRDQRVKAGPNFMADIVERVRSGERATGSLPRYLTPPEGVEEALDLDEDDEAVMRVAEAGGQYRADSSQ